MDKRRATESDGGWKMDHQLHISHAYAKFHVLIRRMDIKFAHEKCLLHICLALDDEPNDKKKKKKQSRSQQQVNERMTTGNAWAFVLANCVSFSYSVHVGELAVEFHVKAIGSD